MLLPLSQKRKSMFEYIVTIVVVVVVEVVVVVVWEKVNNLIIEVAWIAEGSGANIILFSRPQKMFFFYNCNRHHLLFISFFFYIWSHI